MKQKHYCHAEDCNRVVAPAYLMCRSCWQRVPKLLQLRVYRHYVPGQEKRKDPTPEYIQAARNAIDSIKCTTIMEDSSTLSG